MAALCQQRTFSAGATSCIDTAFIEDDAEATRTQSLQRGAAQLRPNVPKLAALMDEAEADVLDFMTFRGVLPAIQVETYMPMTSDRSAGSPSENCRHHPVVALSALKY
jgi:hypothetical protein